MWARLLRLIAPRSDAVEIGSLTRRRLEQIRLREERISQLEQELDYWMGIAQARGVIIKKSMDVRAREVH